MNMTILDWLLFDMTHEPKVTFNMKQKNSRVKDYFQDIQVCFSALTRIVCLGMRLSNH